MTTISARLALTVGALLAVGEVVVNWGDWQWWPFWLVDFLAAGLLLGSGTLVLRGGPRSASALLAGAWGFTCAMSYMGFWSHVERLRSSSAPPSGGELVLTSVIGLLLAASSAGFVLSALGSRSPVPSGGGDPLDGR